MLDCGKEFIHHRKHIRKDKNDDEVIAEKLRKYTEIKNNQYKFADVQPISHALGQQVVEGSGAPSVTDVVITTKLVVMST